MNSSRVSRHVFRGGISVRKSAAIGFVVFVIAATANAQIPTRWSVFAGYSFSSTNDAASITGVGVPGTANLNNWEASLEGKFRPWLGAVADFGAGYGSDNRAFTPLTCATPCPFEGNSVRRYTYLFGPRVSIPAGRFTPFAHFLLGGAHANIRGDTDTSFATAVGGGLDYRLIHGLAWRMQLDNLHTNFFSIGENSLRYSTGVDLRF